MINPTKLIVALCSLVIVLLTGCGSNSQSSATPTATASRTAGDIADTATYLTYKGQGYRVKYVEGWSLQSGAGNSVNISDKDSVERVVVSAGQGASMATLASRDIAHLSASALKYHFLARHTVMLSPGAAAYVQYRALSAPDPVTSKRVSVVVDRYYIPGHGKYATLTLATPVGVDNVDAFKLIARSFRWS